MDPKVLLVIVVIVVMGWFAFGVLYNLRAGNALLRWLQAGLPRVGEKTTLRWLGTSVVDLVIARAKKPFRRLQTLVVLAPRDVPWLWLLAASQGRRDTLIFRADLIDPPRVDFELADPASWTGRLALKQAAQQGWQSQAWNGQPGCELALMAPPGRVAPAASALAALVGPLQRLSTHYSRLSVRRDAPHLEVHIAFPDRRSDAGQFIEALQELARSAAAANAAAGAGEAAAFPAAAG